MDRVRPNDILVLLKLASTGVNASVRELEGSLAVPKSSIALSLQRLAGTGLIDEGRDGRRLNRLAVRDCLRHGIRWIAPARAGDYELGLFTAHSAPPLAAKLAGADDDPLVMPLRHGPHRGRTIEPLDPRAPQAARNDPRLWELLAIVDAFRVGRARDREVAARELEVRL